MKIKQIQDIASIFFQKAQDKGKKYTASDLKSEGHLNKFIHLDEGFRVLRNLRSLLPFFEKCKKDLFAMIRQLGNPIWFSSFSAAETRWTHLDSSSDIESDKVIKRYQRRPKQLKKVVLA